MTRLIALLRAVNVGGTGKLPMQDLKAMCEALGFTNVRTYIASGNVVLDTDGSPEAAQKGIEQCLERYAGKPVGVLIRTADEMAAVLANNPFPDRPPNRIVAIFLEHVPPPDALKTVSGQNEEELRTGLREIYVHYGDGMADSKLKIPAAKAGTARNMNTVAHLAKMASGKGS